MARFALSAQQEDHQFAVATSKSDVPEDPQNEFNFATKAGRYHFITDGKGEFATAKGATRKLVLPLDLNFSIERIAYAEIGTELLLVCEESDGEGGAGFVTKIEESTLKIVWRATIPGFNVGEPLWRSGYLYLTAMGFIGKLDYRSGKYSWQHNGLYEKLFFSAFDKPKIEEGKVYFSEGEKKGNRTIVVDDATGRILTWN
jgi:outer membrane protein assembly factor BamB